MPDQVTNETDDSAGKVAVDDDRTDQVATETDQRLDEAAEILDKVVRDMKDLTSVGDAVLSTKRGLGEASTSIAGLADQASAAMEQWKMALAVFEAAAKTLQSVPVETREAIDAAAARVEESVGNLRAELAEARASSAESARRLRESVESSSRETVEKVAEVAALVERTRDGLGAELKRLQTLLWVGCGVGAVVVVLMVVRVLGP